MRSDAEPGILKGRDRGAAAVQQGAIGVERGEKSRLARAGGGGAEIAMGIEDRQQREADAGGSGGGGDAFGEFGGIGVRRAVRGVMEIVELADRGEPGFRHFGKGERGERLDLVRVQRQHEAIHRLAPRPEVVVRRSRGFGKPCHAALKGVAVDIGEAGDSGAVARVAGRGRNPGLDGREAAALDAGTHALCPSGGQKGFGEPERRHVVPYHADGRGQDG